MHLILARHGNTFAPGDAVVWAGSSNDLPLVEAGRQQAQRLSQALLKGAIVPAAIYCGPLTRTLAYARIVVDCLNLPQAPIVDERLNEIDYGPWTGLTNEQVIEKFGEEELKDWNQESKWPPSGIWGTTEESVIQDVESFVVELVARYKAEDTILVVSSNGRLRYFLSLVPGQFVIRAADGSCKVKTGNICQLEHNDGSYRLNYWDKEPDCLAGLAKGSSLSGRG